MKLQLPRPGESWISDICLWVIGSKTKNYDKYLYIENSKSENPWRLKDLIFYRMIADNFKKVK